MIESEILTQCATSLARSPNLHPFSSLLGSTHQTLQLVRWLSRCHFRPHQLTHLNHVLILLTSFNRSRFELIAFEINLSISRVPGTWATSTSTALLMHGGDGTVWTFPRNCGLTGRVVGEVGSGNLSSQVSKREAGI